MTNFPNFEVAISDADRAEIEAIYIDLLRERDAATQAGSGTAPLPLDIPNNHTGQ
ncbi:MAG TPA: hypothetical protein VK716_06070 [Terracidiphilus sp.]|jgi:hypothetical protein|nr:hypothetical protein [Terracidiphilus sp.]